MEDDPLVGLCLDCGSAVPESMAERDKFLQVGLNGVCKFCGGVMVVCNASEIQTILERRRL